MNQDELQEQEIPKAGFPVDLTEQEFLGFSLTIAKKMGALRTQKPMLILFGVYLILDIVTFVRDYLDTGKINPTLLLIALVTIACAALSMMIMPARIRKTAKSSYISGSDNGYYGELHVTPYAVMKNIGSETVTIPLDAHSLYLEDTEFMAFVAQGQQRTIVLPARCMTPEMAATVRQAVFSEQARIQRRVFSRMEARAATPIAHREMSQISTELYRADFSYNEKELAKLHMDVAMLHFFRSLPMVAALGIMAGVLMAILQETIWWFPGISLAVIFGYLLVMVFSAKARGNKAQETAFRTQLLLTDSGLDIKTSPNGQQMHIGWRGVERAVERTDCVEFYYGGGHLMRIPKRAIPDFDEFRRVVDEHFKK